MLYIKRTVAALVAATVIIPGAIVIALVGIFFLIKKTIK